MEIISEVKVNSKFKLVFILFTCFTLACLLYFKIYFKKKITLESNKQGQIDIPKNRILYDNFGFYPVNDQGVYTFWNVCVESAGFHNERSYKGMKYNETQRIAVYNSFYRVGDQQINVASSANAVMHFWDAIFFRGNIPPTHTFHKTTAFFTITTCLSNFHHFWADTFVSLFNVVKRGNRLKEGSENRIFYRLPIPDLKNAVSNNCHNASRYKLFLQTLYLANDPVVFFQAPTNSCYSSAVFGANSVGLKEPRSIINHTINYFSTHSPTFKASMSKRTCEVVIQDRTTRKMLNIDDLVSAAKSLGFKGVCKVSFETLSIEEQTALMLGARVMVGVQGAGLQWAIFMPEGSVLVEIAWPQKSWGFFYNNFVKPYGIRHIQLISHVVVVNWTSYERMVHKGVKVSEQRRTEMLKGSGVKSSVDNLWKWADVRVDVTSFRDFLSSFL